MQTCKSKNRTEYNGANPSLVKQKLSAKGYLIGRLDLRYTFPRVHQSAKGYLACLTLFSMCLATVATNQLGIDNS